MVAPLRAGQAVQRWRRLHLRGLVIAALVIAPTFFAVSGSSAQSQTTAVGDRYSGEVYVQPAYRQAAGAGGPTLSWPGKTAASEPQPAAPSWGSPSAGYGLQRGAPAYADAAQAYRPASVTPYQAPVTQPVVQTPVYQAPIYQPPAYQAPAYQAPGLQPPAYPAPVARAPAQPARAYGAPPVMPWYQRYGVAQSSSAPAPAAPAPAAQQAGAPQSIYDPPAALSGAPSAAAGAPPVAPVAKAAPTATAANDGETARFYSLHRQYGLTPDPDPIPPQFFSQTADLSDPPGPSPVYKTAASSGGSTTAVHNVPSNDATSTLGQP